MNIIIVGAGASGLMAAKILSAAGAKVDLLEAKKKAGGRINSIIKTSTVLETGAEFIHGNLPLTFELLKQYNLQHTKVGGQIVRVKKGRWFTENDFAPSWDLILDRLNYLKRDITISEFLASNFTESTNIELRKSFQQYVEGYDAADISKASCFAIRDEMNAEEDDQYRVVNGYQGLIDGIAKDCVSHGANIRFNAVVNKISWRKKQAVVSIGKEEFYADKVIITVPVSVIGKAPDQQGGITFTPPLERYTQAAEQIGFGNVIKILLEFDDAFWLSPSFLKEQKIPPPFFIFSDTFVPAWWTQYPGQSPTLTGWIAGPLADTLSDLTDKQILEKAVEDLATLFNKSQKDLYMKLNSSLIYNWRKDPFACGAYSYNYINSSAARAILSVPVEQTIYFAGEAITETINGTVEGAFQSGKKVAQTILSDI